MENKSKNRVIAASFRPSLVIKVLVFAYLTLLMLHGAVLFIAHGLGYDVAMGVVPLFHFDVEQNVPTQYTGLLMLSIVILLVFTALIEQRLSAGAQIPWLFLAVGFALMFGDEMFTFHELVADIVVNNVQVSGAFAFGWVIPYLALVALLGLVLAPWFFRLDRWSQIWSAASGSIYLLGAIGTEMIAGVYISGLAEDRETWRTLTGDLLATLEESMEIIGLSLFLLTLVRRLDRNGYVLSLSLAGRDEENVPKA